MKPAHQRLLGHQSKVSLIHTHWSISSKSIQYSTVPILIGGLHFRTLYTFLDKNQEVTEDNKSLLVETLRQIAEILIWGDQNDATVFE